MSKISVQRLTKSFPASIGKDEPWASFCVSCEQLLQLNAVSYGHLKLLSDNFLMCSVMQL